jgi:hypothetical protein
MPGIVSRRLTGWPTARLAANAHDALLPARCGQATTVERGDDRVPVDPRHRGAVADAGSGLDVADEILAAEEGAVADNQARCGLVGMDALGRGPQRRAELAAGTPASRSGS